MDEQLPPLPEPRTNINEPVNYRASEMKDYATQAVLLERERCAKVAESDEFYGSALRHSIAAAIRKG